MKRAIIIPTHKRFKHWLLNCLETIDTKYPVIVVSNTDETNHFEMRAINTAIKLEIDEFFVMHDTIEVKDNKIFDMIFEQHKGKSLFCNPMGQMFLNKYLLSEIRQLDLPFVKDKRDAIKAETRLHRMYMDKFKPLVLFPNFVDNQKREEKFDRTNMVIENEFLKKYKGTWSEAMIK